MICGVVSYFFGTNYKYQTVNLLISSLGQVIDSSIIWSSPTKGFADGYIMTRDSQLLDTCQNHVTFHLESSRNLQSFVHNISIRMAAYEKFPP